MGGAASAPDDPASAVSTAADAATDSASVSGRTDDVPPPDAKRVAADGADRRSNSVADDAYVAGATPYTEQDEQWLRSGPMSKALDPNLRVTRVASRCPRNGTPRVLECYPLRVAQNLARSETKGFSKNKWNSKKGDAPVPWPNTFWLCCPVAISKIGKLEHEGFIKTYNSRFEHPETQPDPEDALLDATKFRAQHTKYASHRWRLLSPDDVSLAKREGYDAVLEKCGVGGLRVPTQVKCLHLHYAHFLATKDNLVGEWCQNELDARDERAHR